MQAANDAVSTLNGDTLHVEASATPYSAVNFSKVVVIIGNGFFLGGVGSNPGLQQDVNSSIINGDCNFFSSNSGAGAPNTGAGANLGAKMMGIVVNGTLRLRNVSNILVTRCRLASIVFKNYGTTAGVMGNGVNVRFTKNFVSAGVSSTGFTGTPSLDVIFENSIFSSAFGAGSFSINLPNTVKGLFRNNVINESGGFGLSIDNFYVTNNIFSNANSFLSSGNVNNIYKNNIFVNSSAGNGVVNGVDGNITGVAVTNIFATNPNTGTGDSRFQILNAVTNPANNGGETIGVVITPDCGAFGATNPYKLSGIPAVPTIYNLLIPSAVLTGTTTMQISVSTKGNN